MTVFHIYKKRLQIFITIATCLLVFKLLYESKWEFKWLFRFDIEHAILILITFFILLITSLIPIVVIFRKIIKKDTSFWQLLPVLLIGRMANILFPHSGTIYKAISLKHNFDTTYTQYINIFTFFSWINLLLNFFLAIIMILLFMPGIILFKIPALFIILFLFIITLTGPFLVYHTLLLFKFDNKLTFKIYERIIGLFQSLTINGKDTILLSKILFFGILTFILNIIIFKLAFSGMDILISYEHIALLTVVKKISNLFFITPGNIGVQELLYGIICESIGIGIAQGIKASVILRVVGYVVILPLGMMFGGLRLIRNIYL